jgi:hypothetical protein
MADAALTLHHGTAESPERVMSVDLAVAGPFPVNPQQPTLVDEGQYQK